MVNAGFNPLEEIARKTGKSIGELKEEMSKGAISSKMVQDAFISATSAGGKFFGMSSEGAKTLNGQISMLGESFDMMFNEIGEKGEGVIMNAVKAGTYLVDNYETIGKIVLGLVATYGIYRAALVLNIAIEKAQAIVRLSVIKGVSLYSVATDILKAKIAALNGTMLASPYFWVAAAIVGVVAAIYSYNKSISAAGKAQKALNDIQNEAKKKLEDVKLKINLLVDAAKNEKLSLAERKKAIDELNDIIPNYNGNLDETTGKYKENKEALDQYLKSLQRKYELEGAKDKLRELGKRKTDAIIKYNEELRKAEEYDKGHSDRESFGGTFAAAMTGGRTPTRGQARNANKIGAKERLNEALEEIKFTQKAINNIYGEDLQKDEVEQSGGGKKKKKKKNGNGGKPTPVDNGKIRDNVMSRRTELQQALNELEDQVEQSRIDALMDGSEKTLSAMKLAHKKELEQIEKQRQDYLKKKQEEAKAEFEANPKNNGKAFDASSVTLTQDEQDKFDTIRENTNNKYKNETDAFLRQQEQAHTVYLKEYGSMQEQRAAIAREFDEKIAYESNEWTKKTLEKQKETALASFDFSEFQKAINWDVVFGDLTKLSDTALSMLEKQLLAVREKISSKGILSADDTEQLKTISNALENVVAQKVSNAPLEAVVNSISEYRSSLDELKRVQEDMDRINATSYDGVMTLGEAYENALEKQDMATVAKIQDTYVTIKYKDATGKTRIGVMKYIDALKRLQKQQTRTSASAKKLQEGINGVGGKLSQIAQIGGEVTRLADAIGVKMPESIGMTIDGIGDMGEAMEAFDISKPGSFLNVKNYIKFATGVTNAFKGIGKTIGGIFGWGGSAAKSLREYQSAVAKYSALRDVWDDLIDRKKKYLDMSWGSDAYKTQKEIEALIEAETKSIVAEANAYLGTKDKHHGKSHTNYTWQSDIFSNGNFSKGSDHNNEAFWEELEKKLKENGLTKDRNGKDLNIKGVGDLFNLTYDELVMIKTLYPERWALLSKETREYLDKYMESMKNADEATRKYMDSIIGSISEISEALRKFADDSKASAEDVMRAFNETINNSIWKELTKEGSEYYRRMEEYQKHYEEAIRDGHLSEEEKKELEEEYLGIYNDINEKYDKRVAEMGTGDTSSSQNATANGISQISYEQANDITGLVTASNIAGEQRNVKLDTANAHFSLMNATLADIKAYMLNSPQDNNIADETRTILANSYLELRGINENTGNSAAHLKEIRSDIKDMKRIIKDL